MSHKLFSQWRIVSVLSLGLTVTATSGCGNSKPDSPADGEWRTFENEAGARNYLLYSPERSPASDGLIPLVVYLHGCGRTVERAAISTGWTELARRYGFAVVYPEQTDSGCWNWSDDAHQHRDRGEPAIIAGITREVIETFQIDTHRVYVAGTSAGGYMANIMAVTYPDLYASVAILAAGPYGLGSNSVADPTGSLILAEMGTRARVMPAYVSQGTNDHLNPAVVAPLAAQQWLGLADQVDDGALNYSVSRTPASEETHAVDELPQPGSGDPCLNDPANPCPGGIIGYENHYPYTVMHYADADGEPLIDFRLVYTADHNYNTGDDPMSRDLTPAVYAFFLAHPMKR